MTTMAKTEDVRRLLQEIAEGHDSAWVFAPLDLREAARPYVSLRPFGLVTPNAAGECLLRASPRRARATKGR